MGEEVMHSTLSCICTVERLVRDNCQIDGDDLINYEGK